MASMWRRAMVYLGLQDDDELEYGGEYESYGEYADAAEEPQNPAPPRPGATRPTAAAARPATRAPCAPGPTPAPSTAPTTAPPSRRPPPSRALHRSARSRRACRRPGPSVVRTIGPTTAARVHVVEPQGFNDAQEVGDRLKANQPVILNLQGLPRELQRRLIDFSSGLAYAVGGLDAAGRRPGLPAHAEQRRGLPGGEGPAPGPGPVPTLTRAHRPRGYAVTLYLVILAGRAVLSWFPVRGGTFLASLNTLLFELTEPVLRPVRRVIPPAGMFDTSFLIVFFGLIDPAARCSHPADRRVRRVPVPSSLPWPPMDVTPQELRSSEIKDSWRGYDRDEVDDLLERAAVTIEGLSQKLQDVASRARAGGRRGAAPAEVPLPSSREDAEMLQRTLAARAARRRRRGQRGAGARPAAARGVRGQGAVAGERRRGDRAPHRRG